MADIRFNRPRSSSLWLWMGLLAGIALAAWGSAYIFGDRTDPDEQPRVGASADFGALRAPVLPARSVSFSQITPPSDRDLGRRVRFTGVAQSPVRANAVWARSDTGYRILVRFEPPPPEGALQGYGPGSRLEFDGYLQTISRAEFRGWQDSLGISLPPRPSRPTTHYGYAPDPAFARVDSLFIKDFYVSVRPEALQPDLEDEQSPT